jgi:signal transduction histidine kinase/ActR/RegA family two-component response regulator
MRPLTSIRMLAAALQSEPLPTPVPDPNWTGTAILAGLTAAAGGSAVATTLLWMRARRRLAEHARRHAADAALLRALFRACPVGLFAFGPQGRVQDANDTFLALVGRTRNEMDAGRVRWSPPATPDEPSGSLAYDAEHTRPDGTRVPVQVSLALGGADGGVGFVADLRALRDSEGRLRRVAGFVRVAAWEWDVTQDRLDIAPTGLEPLLFDRPAGSIRRMADVLALVEPAYRGLVLRSMLQVMRGGTEMTEHDAEFPIQGSDGAPRWLHAASRVTARDPKGRPRRLAGVVVDISERRRIADALRGLTDDLERRVREEVAAREAAQLRAARAERLQALGQLASGIAHDINNVLQAVASAAALIEHHPRDAEAFARFARILANATNRGASITQRLLSFARRDDLRAEALDPATLLAGMREILSHTLGGSIEVRAQPAEGVPRVMADRGQLETVLLNLAANARDAMPGGGVLTLSAFPYVADAGSRPDLFGEPPPELAPGRYVCMAVTDTGTGIDPVLLPHVVEPFFSTKPIEKGTGLGLSMAKGFAEGSGGALTIASVPNRGTTVTIFLPETNVVAAPPPAAAPDIIEPVPAAAVEPAPSAPRRSPASIRVLLVDDDVLVCESMHEMLADDGFQVVSATSAEAAFARVEAGDLFDILVTDLSMPRLDGLSLIHLVHERHPQMPAILLTGFSEGSVAAAVDAATGGRVSVLRKPAPAAELMARIAALVPIESADRTDG